MIAKNEEEFLDLCLSRLRPIVDEVIIIDTGSTDKTVDIAKKYADILLEEEWQNSFAYHRNKVLDKASCEWVLSIDADEVILELCDNAIRKSLDDAIEKQATFIHFYSFQFGFEFPVVLLSAVSMSGLPLFKNGIGYKWYGDRHNKLSLTPATIKTPYTNKSVKVPTLVERGPEYIVPVNMCISHHYGRFKRNWGEIAAQRHKYENPSSSITGELIVDNQRKRFYSEIGIEFPEQLQTIDFKTIDGKMIREPYLYNGPYPSELDSMDWIKKIGK